MNRTLFLLNSASLVDRDLAYCLRRAGHEVLIDEINLARTEAGHLAEMISSERFIALLDDFSPGLVLSVNGLGMDNEGFCAGELFRRGVPYATWYVDQPRLANMGARYLPANSYVFCFDRYFVPRLKSWGFDLSYYLPLATNPERFRPFQGSQRVASVCFVGDSDYSTIAYLAANLDKELGSLGDPFYHGIERAIDLLLQGDGRQLPELLRATLAVSGTAWENLHTAQRDMLEGFVEREASLRKRTALLTGLHELYPLAIYGDELWADVFGDVCRGKANYFDDTIVEVYNRYALHVNISRFQLVTAVNQRPFDISACEGFVLCDERQSLRELFDEDELASYSDADELVELAGYYLKNEVARRTLAIKARERVLKEHTYQNRIARILQTVLG